MLSTVAFALALVVSISAAHITYVDFRALPRPKLLPFGRALLRNDSQTEPPQCTSPGRICHGCDKVIICDGNNKPIEAATCIYPETCNTGVCSKTPLPQCSDLAQEQFKCNDEGVFPDVVDCQTYHYCIGDDKAPSTSLVDHSRKCELMAKQGYSYNALTKICDRALSTPLNQCVGFPVPLCTSAGQTAALKDTNTIYYICLERNRKNASPAQTTVILYPELYACKNGYVYNGNYNCVLKK